MNFYSKVKVSYHFRFSSIPIKQSTERVSFQVENMDVKIKFRRRHVHLKIIRTDTRTETRVEFTWPKNITHNKMEFFELWWPLATYFKPLWEYITKEALYFAHFPIIMCLELIHWQCSKSSTMDTFILTNQSHSLPPHRTFRRAYYPKSCPVGPIS